jgi:acetyl-CoA acetyltransferase
LKGTKRVALVGAALSDIGRVDTHTPYELHYQAASRAIADAGLTKNDIDGLGSSGTGLLSPIEIGEYLGLRPTWADGTGVGGSTWEFMVEHATAALMAGHVEVVVLVYGSTTRADLKARRRTANLGFGGRGPVQFDAPFGHSLIAKYAMAARRHMIEFGTKIEQLAEISVSSRYNASLNP